MAISFDNALGVHPQALALRSRRAELLAGNLANADTPNYKARDIDFRAALGAARAAGSGVEQVRTHARHVSAPAAGSPPDIGFRVPLHPAVDGNTVDGHREQAEFARNALAFQASFSFLSSKFRGMANAFKGE